MKKHIWGIVIVLSIILLTGCGSSKKPELKLCDEITPRIEDYNENKITYEEFLDEIYKDYKKICIDKKDNNSVCNAIEDMINYSDKQYELEDCNSLTNDKKNVCEASNELIKDKINDKKNIEDAYIDSIDLTCQKVKKENEM